MFERPEQQHARLYPVPLHGAHVDAKDIRNVVFGKAPEKAQFDHARKSRVERLELEQGVIHLDHNTSLVVDNHNIGIERNGAFYTSPLRGDSATSVVNEDLPHRNRGDTEKVCTVAPSRPRLCGDLEVRLAYQPRGCERRVNARQ